MNYERYFFMLGYMQSTILILFVVLKLLSVFPEKDILFVDGMTFGLMISVMVYLIIVIPLAVKQFTKSE
jgi:hypothetical protein